MSAKLRCMPARWPLLLLLKQMGWCGLMVCTHAEGTAQHALPDQPETRIANRGGERVTDDPVRIGFLVTPTAPDSTSSRRDRHLISAGLEEVNRRGGICHRRLELADVADSAAQRTSAAVLLLLATDDGAINNEERQTTAETSARLTLRISARSSDEQNRMVFSLYPGLVERARALARYAAAHRSPSTPFVAAIYSSSTPFVAIDEIIKTADPGAALKTLALDRAKSDEIIRLLRASEIDQAILIGPSGEFGELIAETHRAQWEPLFLWTNRPPLSLRLPRAMVAQISLPTHVSTQALAAYEQWRLGAPPGDDLDHDFAVAALITLTVEALQITGRDLTVENVIKTLESGREFQTGYSPSLVFTPERHIGTAGLYIVPLPSSRYQPAVEWAPSK